jgi:hypothetical protein
MRLARAVTAAFVLLSSVFCRPVLADFSYPGPLSLGAFTVGAAATQVGTPALNLAGMTALSCQARFAYGTGGTKTNVYIQSSLDQGQSWYDVANIAFTTSSGVADINLSGLNSVTTPTAPVSQALADNTTFNGPLGDRLQAVVVSTGTYGGQTLVSVYCNAR